MRHKRGTGHHSQLPVISPSPIRSGDLVERKLMLPLSLPPRLRVAVGAVHRAPVSGLEGYLGVGAASGTYSRVHFSLLSVAAVASAAVAIPIAAALYFSGCTAVRTTPRIMGEALGSEELLLGCAECEACVAI